MNNSCLLLGHSELHGGFIFLRLSQYVVSVEAYICIILDLIRDLSVSCVGSLMG